jgi:O-antigen/teichoic acid export membrane protein
VLALTNLLLAMSGPLTNFLLALGRFRFLTAMSVAMAGLNGILLLIFLPRYGIIGAAWAYLLSVLPIGYMFYYSEKNFLQLPNRRHYYASALFKLTITTIVFAAACWLFFRPLISNLPTLIVLGPLSVLTFLLIHRLLGFFEPEDLTDIRIFAGRLLAKWVGQKKQ